jgi:tetratricopeptide (TPR) repeat protein
MPNHNKKQKKQEHISQSVAAFTSAGSKAFYQKDFSKAILAWEKIPAALRPAAMLAEAYFRLGLRLFYGAEPETGLNHLQTAASYQPQDPRYAYHVGLALQRRGDLVSALAAYQTVYKIPGPFAARAAYPLALISLQLGEDPAAAQSWSALTANDQAYLCSASAFRRRPYNLLPEAPRLWHALAAFDRQDSAQAQVSLAEVLSGAASATEKGLAHYYQGLLAARGEDWQAARRSLSAAAAAGLRLPRLDNNLAELFQRYAEELLGKGDVQTALAAAKEAHRHLPNDKSLGELLGQIHQQLGYQAATADQWDQAQSHWQAAVELDSSSFRLAYNLALAYEKSENYVLAGQTWREALRRRPRRADSPDMLNDEQVARLWHRAAVCYTKAEEFNEAELTYQQAIKWAPENLELRLALATNLINNGRMQAGRNELVRVLERNPNHIPALLRLGEAFFRDEDIPWYDKLKAKKAWEKVLAIEPKNPQAIQLLAEWYIDQAEISDSWDNYPEAIENYLNALRYRPNQVKTIVALALCYIGLKDTPHAEEYAAQATSLAANIEDFATIIDFWLRVKESERAWEMTAQAESRFGRLPTDLFVVMAHNLIEVKRPDEAITWLEHAIEKALPEDNVFFMIGEAMMDIDSQLASKYLQKAVDARQMLGKTHILLGMIEADQDHKAASKKHFSEAERIAKQTKDADLLSQIEMARMFASGPQAMFRRLMEMDNEDEMEDFMNAFGEEFNLDD